MIGLKADPHDEEDFDVSEAAIERALEQRRMRGAQLAPTKERITIRLDAETLARFRATGPGWQARINDALRNARP